MPAPTRPTRAPRASTRELLDAIAPAFDLDEHDTLIHAVRRRRTVDLGVLPLEPGDAAIEHLIGATAPPDWSVLGFTTRATVRLLVDDGSAEAAGSRPARLVVLADRNGDVATALRSGGDPLDDLPPTVAIDERPTGWIVDVCQRALGIPTAPPGAGIDAWLDVLWLDAVVAAVAGTPQRAWSWADLAVLHPLHPDGPAISPERLRSECEGAAATMSWSRLRALVRSGSDSLGSVASSRAGEAPVLTPQLAAWFDDGAFSRFVLGRYPPADVLLRALAELLPTDRLARIRAGLAGPTP